MRGALFTALAILALLPAAGAAYATPAGPLSWDPDPPQPGQPLTVRLTLDGDPARNATLKFCYAEAGKAVLCLLPKPMAKLREGVFEVTVDDEMPPGQEIGLNASWTDGNGGEWHWPEGDLPVDEAYVFVRVAEAERAVPGASLLAILTGLGIAALTAHHNLERGLRRLRP